MLPIACSSNGTEKEGVGTSTQALTTETAEAEISRLETLVATRYNDHLLSLTDSERSREGAAAEAAGASGYQLFTEWSHRGVLRSLWSLRMRIPVASPLSATPQEKAFRFLDDHGAIFGLSSAGSALQVERTGPREGGGSVVRLKETLRGLPVFGAELILHVGLEGDIEWLAGLVLPESEVASASATPALTADMAAEAVGGTAFGSELGWFDPEAFGLPMEPARLAWRVRSALGPRGYDVYIDAETGHELARVSLIHMDEHKEIFHAIGSGLFDLPGSLQFDDVCHLFGDAACNPPCECISGDCINSSWEGTSNDIYENTNITYDYYLERHGRDSWDNGECGHGHPTCVDANLHRMRASSDYNYFGDCNASWTTLGAWPFPPAQTAFGDKRYCLDQVGHEFTHGVDEIEANLNYANCTQSKTMKEAFSDVFGEFIERYHTGTTADWVCGTGCPACASARNSNLVNPALFSTNCDLPDYPSCGGPGTSLPQPDHWSNYRKECNGHWNSTIISKAGYLMGRETSEGFKTHWGLGVRGIGEVAGGKVWYNVLNDYLSSNATFTEFRNATYSSCHYYCVDLSMCNYGLCLDSVDAVGLWSSDAGQGFNTASPVEVEKWTVNGQVRRYIFYKDPSNTNLYYRYRTCSINGDCSWSSAVNFYSGTSGPSSAIFPGSYMWACYRSTGGSLLCDRWNSSGANSYKDPGYSLMGEPSLVYFNNTLYLAYEKSNNDVYWCKYNSATDSWGPENAAGFKTIYPPVLASSREDYKDPNDNYLWIVYNSYSAGRLAYRRFYSGSSTWGTERLAGQSDQSPTPFSQTRPAVSFFRGRLHVAILTSATLVWYMSCAMPCTGGSLHWTRLVEQDPDAKSGLTLDNYGEADGNLYLWHRRVQSAVFQI